jgi:hypothetical protein
VALDKLPVLGGDSEPKTARVRTHKVLWAQRDQFARPHCPIATEKNGNREPFAQYGPTTLRDLPDFWFFGDAIGHRLFNLDDSPDPRESDRWIPIESSRRHRPMKDCVDRGPIGATGLVCRASKVDPQSREIQVVNLSCKLRVGVNPRRGPVLLRQFQVALL